MSISDWSSDVCSSDLAGPCLRWRSREPPEQKPYRFPGKILKPQIQRGDARERVTRVFAIGQRSQEYVLGHPQPTAMDRLQGSRRESARGNNDRIRGSGTGKQINQHTASAFFSFSFVKADVIGRQIPTRHPGNVSVRSLAVPRIVFRTRDKRHFARPVAVKARSEEHTSELQSLMRTSYS